MPKPHLPTFAVTALSLPDEPVANPAIQCRHAPAWLAPASPSGIVGALARPSLAGAQGWQ
jgi:hypothetical protein